MKNKAALIVGATMAMNFGLAACEGDDGPVPEPPTGASCQSATPVTDPGTATGDTRGHANASEGTCITGDAPDAYLTVKAAMTGMLDLTLDSEVDLGLYVRTDCVEAASEIGCADSGKAGETETLSVPVTEGQTVWVVVDGFNPEDAGAFTLHAESRPIVCGDGRAEGTEACDPPDGITCTDTCQGIPEICDDGADNDVDGLADCEDTEACISDTATCPIAATCGAAQPALPSDAGDTSTGTKLFAGSCTGDHLAAEELRSFQPPSTGVLLATLQSAVDLGIYVRSGCDDPATELGCLDDAPGGTAETLVVPVEAGGPVTLFIDGGDPAEAGPFTLITEHRAATEAEPNGSTMDATQFSDPFVAAISPAGDEDFIRVQVPGPSSTLTAAVVDFGNDDCKNFKIDSVLEIYGPDGTTSLAFNDDNGNFCSRAIASGLPAGDYFIRVAASRIATHPTFAYQLSVQIN